LIASSASLVSAPPPGLSRFHFIVNLQFTMTQTKSAPASTAASSGSEIATNFAAIALAAVSWDGVLTMAGSRALRHALDYRSPFSSYGDQRMVALMDELLARLRASGAQHMMIEAAEQLTPQQRGTAYAMAAEIMRSDAPLSDDERNILSNLAAALELDPALTAEVHRVMDLLHATIEA